MPAKKNKMPIKIAYKKAAENKAAEKTPETPQPSEDDAVSPPPSSRSPSRSRSPCAGASVPEKKRRKKPLVLTEDQEIEMAEWLLNHPFVYTKSMKEYKNISKKNRLWDNKAEELDVESSDILKTWYGSMRTRIGKITEKKSGSAKKDLTERDTFLMQHFRFLTTHISRVKARPACSVSTMIYVISALAHSRPVQHYNMQ